MSIIIQNIDKNPRRVGPHSYVLRINNKVIAYFTHERGDGLAACLHRAGIAADSPDRQEVKDHDDFLVACMHAAGSEEK